MKEEEVNLNLKSASLSADSDSDSESESDSRRRRRTTNIIARVLTLEATSTMPRRPVRPFIGRNEGVSFQVVHRANSDPLSADADAPQNVLVSTSAPQPTPEFHGTRLRPSISASYERPVGELETDDARSQATRASAARSAARSVARSAARSGGAGGGAGGGATARSSMTTGSTRSAGLPFARRVGRAVEISEVDESGNPLDGYDYGAHLAVGGGGVFLPARGSASSVAGGSVSRESVVSGARSVARSELAAAARNIKSAEERAEEQLDGLYLTHDEVARAGIALPRDVLPALPEEVEDADVVTLREESMPGDLRSLLEALEEEDVSDFSLPPVAEAAREDGDSEGEGGAAPAKSHAASLLVKGAIVEVLDDNFMLQAMGMEPIPEWPAGAVAEEEFIATGAPAPFDFDAHVARLMELAEGKMEDDDGATDFGDDDFDDDGDDGDDNNDDDDDDEYDGEEKEEDDVQEAKLSRLLAMYGEEDIGELDPDDPRVRADGFARVRTLASAGDDSASPLGAANTVPGLSASRTLERLAESYLSARDEGFAGELRLAAIEATANIKARKEAEYRAARRAAELADKRRRGIKVEEEEEEEEEEKGGLGDDDYDDDDDENREDDEDEDDSRPAAPLPAAHLPAPPAPVAPPSSAFKINLSLLKKPAAAGAASIALPSAQPERPPSPVSSSAASAAAAATLASSQRMAAFPDTRPVTSFFSSSVAAQSSADFSAVPYGCADGDLPEETALIPPTWGRKATRTEDVETVLSSRSNHLHHPRTLGDAPASVVSAAQSSSGPRMLGAGAHVGGDGASSSGSGPVRVSRRTGLPRDVTLAIDARTGAVRLARTAAAVVEDVYEDDDEDNDDAAGKGDASDSDQDSSGSEQQAGAGGGKGVHDARPSDETPDERRARKGAVRAARAQRRLQKKALSTAFKKEAVRQGTMNAKKDVLEKGIPLGGVR